MELATTVSEIWAPSNGSTKVRGCDAAPLSLEPKIQTFTTCITKCLQTLDSYSLRWHTFFKKQGSSYNWILDLCKRMGSPELEELKESVSQACTCELTLIVDCYTILFLVHIL